ncbi:MAG: dihydroneopterin aldolase [Candidatus Poseidoniales archaeon]|nr:MAG: dihydroneopterin aldolase [Candidatus Poseidoniales archaeon]
MQWRVGLQGYEVRAVHGFYDQEHVAPQPFVFTVWATLAGEQRIESLEETLNYADIQIAIDEVMLNAPEPIRLMEEMAQQIIDRLSNHQSVASISIRIEKPNAPLPHPGGLPAIEAEWHRG